MSSTLELENRIRIFGFEGVTNSSVIAESMREDVRFAVVDLSLVCSVFHLRSAAYKALLNEQQTNMKTKSISAEILYQLSATTNINESLKQHRVHIESQFIAFVVVDDDSVSLELMSRVEGKVLDLNALDSPAVLTAEKASTLAKYFKITAQELEISSLENSIATRIAMKDCL